MTGQKLDEELLLVGLDRERLAIMNAMLCLPKEAKSAADMRKATNCCKPAFEYQRSKLPATLHVMALGKWAAFAVFGKDKKVFKGRGFVRP